MVADNVMVICNPPLLQVSELIQCILGCGWDFNRNSMGDTGRLVSEVVLLRLGLVDRCGNSVLKITSQSLFFLIE